MAGQGQAVGDRGRMSGPAPHRPTGEIERLLSSAALLRRDKCGGNPENRETPLWPGDGQRRTKAVSPLRSATALHRITREPPVHGRIVVRFAVVQGFQWPDDPRFMGRDINI